MNLRYETIHTLFVLSDFKSVVNKMSNTPGCLSEGLMSFITFRSLNSCSSFFPPNTYSCQHNTHTHTHTHSLFHIITHDNNEHNHMNEMLMTYVTVEDEGRVSVSTSRRNPDVQRNLPLPLSWRNTGGGGDHNSERGFCSSVNVQFLTHQY